MHVGEIRLIRWGLIPNLPYFEITVDRMVGGDENLKVIQIVREWISPGKYEYHVQCAKKDDKGNLGTPFVWNTYLKEPDKIQYFVPDDKHNYIKM